MTAWSQINIKTLTAFPFFILLKVSVITDIRINSCQFSCCLSSKTGLCWKWWDRGSENHSCGYIHKTPCWGFSVIVSFLINRLLSHKQCVFLQPERLHSAFASLEKNPLGKIWMQFMFARHLQGSISEHSRGSSHILTLCQMADRLWEGRSRTHTTSHLWS